METLEKTLSIFGNTVTIIVTILSALIQIYGRANLRKTLERIISYFTNKKKEPPAKKVKTKKTKQSTHLPSPDEVFINEIDEERRKKSLFNYLYILAGLLVIPVLLITITTNITSSSTPEVVSDSINWSASGGMNIVSLLWMLTILFSIIGFIRGWIKEILVVFSVVVALVLNFLLRKYFPFINDLPENSIILFWMQTIILVSLVYFGYQAISISASKLARERLSDALFGAVIGGMNGYLIIGSILAYFHNAEYPYQNIIAPASDPVFLETIKKTMASLPPNSLGEPGIYFAAVLMIVFIVVVFV